MGQKRSIRAGVATLALMCALSGCAQPLSTREKSTLVGGGLGGAAGAIIGAAVGNPGAGAAIGTALGAGTGALVGDRLQNQESIQAQQQREIDQQQREIERQRRELEELRRQQQRRTTEDDYY
jgi:uncharacterized protein YcfJ